MGRFVERLLDSVYDENSISIVPTAVIPARREPRRSENIFHGIAVTGIAVTLYRFVAIKIASCR